MYTVFKTYAIQTYRKQFQCVFRKIRNIWYVMLDILVFLYRPGAYFPCKFYQC